MRVARVHQIDIGAFDQFCGNPVTVVTNGHVLSEKEMKLTAGEMQNFLTAVLLPSVDADFRVRTFKVDGTELPFCIESCVAVLCAIRQEGLYGADGQNKIDYTVETLEGFIPMSIDPQAEENIYYSLGPVEQKAVLSEDAKDPLAEEEPHIDSQIPFIVDEETRSVYFKVAELSSIYQPVFEQAMFHRSLINRDFRIYVPYFIVSNSDRFHEIYMRPTNPKDPERAVSHRETNLTGLLFAILRHHPELSANKELILYKEGRSERPESIRVDLLSVGETMKIAVRSQAYPVFQTTIVLCY